MVMRWTGLRQLSSGVSRTRQVALEAAKRRREREETTNALKAAAAKQKRLRYVPFVAVGIAAAVGVLGFTEKGRRFFSEYIYDRTIVGAVGEYVDESIREFTDPISENLLPDFPGDVLHPPRTLVIDFEDTLCHLEWSRKKGWTAVKRPGVDMFLARLASYYEIVLFTDGNYGFLEPYVEAIDPYRLISHRLFRESTLYENGEHVKDISKLNRDPRRVVVVDDKILKKQPENCVQIKAFTDIYNPDSELLSLLPFLEDLAKDDVPDVRTEIAKYEGKYIPSEYKRIVDERERREAERRAGTLGGFVRKGGIMGGAARPGTAAKGAAEQPLPSSPPQEEDKAKSSSSSLWASWLQK